MDSLPPNYKYFIVSRGFKYYYYFSAPNDRPTLLLIRAFPSLSFDWFNRID
jgi:hypothetical protein